MPDPLWYYYQDNAQQGPLPLETLRALADQGKLRPDSLVTRIGMADWLPAKLVPELFPQESAMRPPLPPGVGPRRDVLAAGRNLAERLHRVAGADDVTETLPHLRLVRLLLKGLRRGLTESGLGAADLVARQTGHLAYVLAAVLLVLDYLVLGIRSDSFRLTFGGLLLIAPAAILLHYIAASFLDAGFSLLRKSPSELSSPAILTFFALLFFAGSVVCFGLGLYGVILGGSLLRFGFWLGMTALLLYACGIALNPATVNVNPASGLSAGEEALGILLFLLKVPVRLVPFLFGVGAVVGVCAAVYLLYLVFTQAPVFLVEQAHEIAHGVLGVALLPLLAYLGFVVSALLVEVLRAILRIPGKIDSLRSDVNGGPPAAG
ncbi:MAG TPA: DUF4339 domain-containing protein [Thermoanaerobaculia bacterium]|jgi:hypothetical protein|nr:DUF4339 domain-containing protein [Thermoanaerobaculia bacterium]